MSLCKTTAYGRFEDYADKLHHAAITVHAMTEHDSLGVVQRVRLRYIDIVRPRDAEDFREYLRPVLHGTSDDIFQPLNHRLRVESTGKTEVGSGILGTMIVRVVQNDQGISLPPDLISAPPRYVERAERCEVVTLIDMDHFIEGTFDPDADLIVEKAYELHDHVIETFHEHVVSAAAIEVWK